jgi:hypothetical protein
MSKKKGKKHIWEFEFEYQFNDGAGHVNVKAKRKRGAKKKFRRDWPKNEILFVTKQD